MLSYRSADWASFGIGSGEGQNIVACQLGLEGEDGPGLVPG